MINGKFVTPPDLQDLVEMQKTDIMASLRVCVPGTIFSYDAIKRTAVIQPGYNRVYNNDTVKPYPLLVDCPVFTLQGGGIHMAFPIKKGDECLVVFADASIDAWYQNGGIQTPPNYRRHDLSDGFAIVGVNSLANPLGTPLTSTEGGLADDEAKVAVDAGKVTVANSTTTLLQLLLNLVTLIENLTTSGGPTAQATDVATKALLEAYKITLQELLY